MALQSAHSPEPFLFSCSHDNPHLFAISTWEGEGGAILAEIPGDQCDKHAEDKPHDR